MRPLLIAALALVAAVLAVMPTDARRPDDAAEVTWRAPALPDREAADLSWLDPQGMARAAVGASLSRAALGQLRAERAAAGDAVGVARVNALFAAEGLVRSRAVLERWLGRFDPKTGLIPTSTAPDGRLWAYGDTGSDLVPHLAIATHLLAPQYDRRFRRLLEAERRLGPDVPDDVRIPSGERLGLSARDRIFGVAEYAKDGLLPMLDRLGPDPWLGRLAELADRLVAASATPTRDYGLIPADSTEVNGDMLQVLARVYWATGERRYLDAATRIARTYVEDVLPTTTYLPPNRWDFVENEPLDRRRFRLSDHGNEILSGLLEWHLAATLSGDPKAPADRVVLRKMLDRLLDKGRSADGLWLRVIEIPSGRVEQEGLTDSWGYVSQALLIQELVERIAPDGDPAAAERYRDAAARSLAALAAHRGYDWEQGKMDGYADAIEGAVYLLHELDDPSAEAWLDDQIGVLYAFQQADGAVVERDLDGNFIRTALLDAFRRTGGARLDPWSPDVLLGGAREPGCLTLWLASSAPWQGRLVLDQPRHRLYGHLPYDYPRLNKWPEWFVAEAGQPYRLEDERGGTTELDGETLAVGLPLALAPGETRTLRICRAP